VETQAHQVHRVTPVNREERAKQELLGPSVQLALLALQAIKDRLGFLEPQGPLETVVRKET